MAVKAIQHGTRNGYRHGCRDRNTCPGNEKGVTCIDAANEYNRDIRAAHKQARQNASRRPKNTGPKPGAPRYRVLSGIPRSEARDADTTDGQGNTFPNPDMPVFEPPDSLVNARVGDDPEPEGAEHDVYNDPEFLITPKIKNDIAGKLGLFAAIIGMPLEAMDPYCGPIFANNVDNIIEKTVPIICRSPGAVKFFMSTTGGWLDWVAMIQAWWPVIAAIYAHHLARTVGRPSANGVHPTMPPQDNYDYSAA